MRPEILHIKPAPRGCCCCWSMHPTLNGKVFPPSPLSSNRGYHFIEKTDGPDAVLLAPTIKSQTHLAPHSSLLPKPSVGGGPSPSEANPSLGPWILQDIPPSLPPPPFSRIVPPARGLWCLLHHTSPSISFFVVVNKCIYFIYLCLAALGLRCCVRAFSSCGEQGPLCIAMRGLLIAVASLVAEHGL